MAILIDAEKLKLAIRDDPDIPGKMYARMKMHINEATVVDAVPVVHGRWYRTGAENVYGGIEIQCSECGHTFMTSPMHIEEEHFCCKCGADMRGVEDGK